MSKFVLTAQLKLQAPKNTQQVVNQIKSQLSGVSVNVNVKGATQAQRQIKQITAATNQATSAAQNMGKTFGVALKRFAAFTIASRAVSLFTNSLANAVQESIDFQREIIKISQVTGKTTKELKGLSDEITRLSVTLGTSSTDLVAVTRILAQAGIQASDLKVALEALAKTTLAPTFEDINKTAEGAVAILAQFGKGVGDLERQLGAINAVAGQFAVESGDLIGAIRRTGGVFKAAGGDLNEFLGLFTSIRATTRESSESIATGLRTILTRIQRPATIQYLKELGVSLTDLNGRFVGPFEAVKRLSKALADVPAGDLKFIQIAEQLGGFRQIGKVIPLLQQFETAEKARQAAIAGGDSLTKDAATAQQALAVQIVKVKQEFLALVRGITESTSFQVMAKTALSLASALIKVADALSPIIPLLGAFAAVKIARGIGGFAAGIGASLRGVKGKHEGGQIHHFARGGSVPGSGNRDTVPAMLQPGEFVIRKSSVKKIGAGKLEAMNNNKFAEGGIIALQPWDHDEPLTDSGTVRLRSVAKKANLVATKQHTLSSQVQTLAAPGRGASDALQELAFSRSGLTVNATGVTVGDKVAGENFEADIRSGFLSAINNAGAGVANVFGAKVSGEVKDEDLDKLGISSVIGHAFEAYLTKFGVPFTSKGENNAAFDFPDGLGPLGSMERFAALQDIPVDAKRTLTGSKLKEVITTKFPTMLADELKSLRKMKAQESTDQRFTKTGGIKKDDLMAAVSDIVGTKSRSLEDIKKGIKNKFGPETNILAGHLTKGLGMQRSSSGFYSFSGRAAGGSISGSDTVPALLTPGEFVVNKSSARNIGYANLNRMNKKGVTGFAAGGPVGVQRFANGGAVAGGMEFGKLDKLVFILGGLTSVMGSFGDKSKEASEGMFTATVAAERLSAGIMQAATVFQLIKHGKEIVKGWGQSLEESAKKSIQGEKDKLEASKKGMTVDELKKEKAAKDEAAKTSEETAKKEESSVKESAEGTEKKAKKKEEATADAAKKEIDAKKEEEKAADTKKSGEKKEEKVSTARNADQLAKEQEVQKRTDDFEAKQKTFDEDKTANTKSQEQEERQKEQFRQDIAKRDETAQAAEDAKLEGVNKRAAAVTEMGKLETLEETAAADKKEAEGITSASSANIQAAKQQQREHVLLEEGDSSRGIVGRRSQREQKIRELKGKAATTAETAFGGEASPEFGKLAKEIKQLEQESADAAATTQTYTNTISENETNLKNAQTQAATSAQAAEDQAVITQQAKDDANKATKNEEKTQKAATKAKNRVISMEHRLTDTHDRTAKAGTKLAVSETKVQNSAVKLAVARNKEAKQHNPAIVYANKHSRVMQKLIDRNKKAIVEGKRWNNTVLRTKRVVLHTRKAWGKLRGMMRMVPKDAKNATAALKRLNAQMKATKGGKMARMKGAVGKGLGKVAGVGGAVTGVLAAVGIAAQQFAGAAKEIADRRKDMAIDRGDVAGGVKAAKAGALADTMGQAFSFGGMASMIMDPEGFVAGAVKKKEADEADVATTIVSRKQQKMLEGVQSGEKGEFIDNQGSLRVGEFGKAFAAESSKAMAEIDDTTGAKKDELTAKLKQNEGVMATTLGKHASSVQEIEKTFEGMNGATATAKEKLKEMAISAFKVAEANRAMAKANFDNLKVMSAFAASKNAVNNFLSSLETGSLSLEGTIATIEAAQSNMGLGDEGKQALDEARKQVLDSVGGEDSSVGKAVGRSFDRAEGVNDFMSSLQQRIGGLDISTNEETAKKQLEAALTAGVTDGDTRKAIEGAVQGIGPIVGKDISSIVEEIRSGLEPMSKTALSSAKALLQHQQTILQLTQRRRASELAYIDAQKKAIDIQLNAAKIFEDFGGDKLSSEQKEQARVAQFNLVAQDAGIKTLRNASSGELARAREEVSAKTDEQINRRERGGFAGKGGEEERIDELKNTNKALMELTKQRISQIKEEIAIIAKKNAAEKSSFEKLLEGDIEGFIEQQAAAGAAAALRAGDANMASLFSPSALGAGLKSLEGTGMSDNAMQRAAGISLSSMGITDARAAGVMTGTDAETEALKAEGRGLATELGAQGQQMADLQMMEVAATEVRITNSQILFDNNMQKQIAQQNAADLGVGELGGARVGGMYRGGVVYANRGIFVPRGTDTVPAMLTPGEFVVNRAAVNRGNNLQILRAMNSSGRQDATAPATAMSTGGPVGYYQFGDLVQKMGSMFGDAMPALGTAVTSFANAIDKLTGFTMGVDINSIPPISVNVVMPKLAPAIEEIVRKEVANEIGNYQATSNGLKHKQGSVLSNEPPK